MNKTYESQPLVSIVTPVYNAEEYIRESILSVISQSYQNWEMILVDDCSNDNSVRIINEFLGDKRIHLYRNVFNLGAAETRNVALEKCNGKYITFLDSDDFWSCDKLKKQVEFMELHNIHMSHSNYTFCSPNGEPQKNVFVDDRISYFDLLKGNQFKIMTVMLSKDLVASHRFKNIRHEDYAYFLDCLKRNGYSLNYTKDIDSYCRIGKLSLSSNKYKSALWTWKIYREYEKLGMFSSIRYFIHYAINGIAKHRGAK